MKIAIGRIDSIKPLDYQYGDTIMTLVNRAGLSLSRDEVVTDLRGELVEMNEQPEDGQTYVVTQNYKSGSY